MIIGLHPRVLSHNKSKKFVKVIVVKKNKNPNTYCPFKLRSFLLQVDKEFFTLSHQLEIQEEIIVE